MSPQPENRSAFARFVAEMKRRHVVRFAIGYAAAAFVVLQLGEIVLPAFGLGEQWLRVLVIAVTIGFPPALLLAWVFDITTHGFKRTEEPPADQSVTPLLPRLTLTAFTLLVVGGLAVWLGGSVPTGSRGEGGDGPVRPAASGGATEVASVAVLPFRNDSENAEGQDYFTAGMQEELITRLGQIPRLRVASRTSTERYAASDLPALPQIGSELGVDAVIEGAVLRVGDQVRINVALYRASTEERLWGDSFSGTLDDIFALQSEVALEIARAVQGQVSAEDESMIQRNAARDVDPEAADAYLRGRWEAEKGTEDGYRSAMRHFELAVAEDSSFAPALAGLAGSRFLLSLEAPDAPGAEVEQARREALRALAMDSASWEAREVLGYIERALPSGGALPAPRSGDPVGAASGVSVAAGERVTVIKVPGMADSIVVDVGDMDTAWVTAVSRMGQRIEDQVRRRVMIGADGAEHRVGAGQQLLLAGRFDDAADILEDVVDDLPGDVRAWELLAHAEISDGDADDAVRVLEDWAATDAPGAPSREEVRALEEAVDRDGAPAYWRWVATRLSAARREGRPASLTLLATAEAGMGRGDQAVRTLMDALRGGEPAVLGVRNDPAWDALRDDPRLAEILRQAREVRMTRPPTPPRAPSPTGN